MAPKQLHSLLTPRASARSERARPRVQVHQHALGQPDDQRVVLLRRHAGRAAHLRSTGAPVGRSVSAQGCSALLHAALATCSLQVAP